jgi:sRNA-binding protein
VSKLDPALLRTVIELLEEAFPQCFSAYAPRRKPLKIGIHLDILTEAAPSQDGFPGLPDWMKREGGGS